MHKIFFGATRARAAVRRSRAVGTSVWLATAAAGLGALAPGSALACACGCGVFDVGTGAMFPEGSGGNVFMEAAFMDQDRNWSGTSSAPADNNGDKRIRTEFFTVGAQYMFNRSWGVQVDLPFWDRRFTTADPDTGIVSTYQHGAVGDIRIRGVYSGFSPNMSTGITFGVKLPNGDSTYANFDPDTEIGSGSTDLLLGAYHQGRLRADSPVGWFVRGQWQQPVSHKAEYRPGNEVVASAGAYYEGLAGATAVKVTPLLQLTAAYRGHDGGPASNPGDSGYTRLLVTPGVELKVSRVRVYAEVGFAVHNNMSGNQLVARQLYRLSASVGF